MAATLSAHFLHKSCQVSKILLALFFSLLISSPLTALTQEKSLKMVVTAAFVSERGLPVYEELARYMSKKLSIDVSVISGISYEESNLLLHQGVIQIGFVCGLPYTREFDEEDMIAIPVMSLKKGRYPDIPGYEDVPGRYFSYTIVHKDSPINSWRDLKGSHFTYNDINSNSGYNMPRYKLIQLGANSWEEYFSKITVSGSHEESIRLVAKGMVDASSVDSLVLDYDRHIGNTNALNVKVIEALFPGGSGAPPIVLSKKADPKLKAIVQKTLLTMHEDEWGKEILKKSLMSRFIKPSNTNYDDIRKMDNAAKLANFIDHIE